VSSDVTGPPLSRATVDGSAPAAPPHELAQSGRPWQAPVLLGLLGTAVAALGSWVPSFWIDESATLSGARRSLPDLWRMMHHVDAVHGVYYAFMHGWTALFGTSELAVRLPSALAVGCATAGVWVLGRRLLGPAAALVSALVFVVLPRVTWVGTEGRSYAGTVAVAVWATVLLVALLERHRRDPTWSVRRWLAWGAYGLTTGFVVALNVDVAYLVVAHGVTVLLRLRDAGRRALVGWASGAALAAVASWPVNRLTITETGQLPHRVRRVKVLAQELVVNQYFTGATVTRARLVRLPPTTLWGWAAVIFALVGWALVVAGAAVLLARPSGRQAAAVLLPWLLLPTAVLVVGSAAGALYYSPRYLSYTTPAVALVVGAALAALRPGPRWAVLGLVAVLALPVYVSQRTPSAKNGYDWRGQLAYVQEHRLPGDAIYVDGGIEAVREAYPAMLHGLVDVGRPRDPVPRERLFPPEHRLSQVRLPAGVEAVWFLSSALSPHRAHRDDALLGALGLVRSGPTWSGGAQRVSLWVVPGSHAARAHEERRGPTP